VTQHSLFERDAWLLAGAILSGLAIFFSLRTGKTILTPMIFYAGDNPVLYWSMQSITFCIFVSCVLGLLENSGWL
jgi:hypothetical protein